jgi:hypothetical protein
MMAIMKATAMCNLHLWHLCTLKEPNDYKPIEKLGFEQLYPCFRQI